MPYTYTMLQQLEQSSPIVLRNTGTKSGVNVVGYLFKWYTFVVLEGGGTFFKRHTFVVL